MTTSLIRIAILLSLLLAGMLLLLASPSVFSPHWIRTLLLTKAGAAAILYLTHRLYTRWSRTDTIISRYDRWTKI